MASFVREVSEHGNVGAVVRRTLRLPLLAIMTLAWINKGNFLKLAKKDFASGVIFLTQIELLSKPSNQEYVAIADQVVDLSVALQNKRLIEGLVGAVRGQGCKPVLVTNNLADLLPFLSTTSLKNVWFAYSRDPQGGARLLESTRIIPSELVA